MEASDDENPVKLDTNEVQEASEIIKNRNAKSEEIKALFMRFPHLVKKASYGQLKACQFLMKNLLNGNPKKRFYGHTALHIAARNAHLNIC